MFAVRVLLLTSVVFAAFAALVAGGVITASAGWLLPGAVGCLSAALLVERKP